MNCKDKLVKLPAVAKELSADQDFNNYVDEILRIDRTIKTTKAKQTSANIIDLTNDDYIFDHHTAGEAGNTTPGQRRKRGASPATGHINKKKTEPVTKQMRDRSSVKSSSSMRKLSSIQQYEEFSEGSDDDENLHGQQLKELVLLRASLLKRHDHLVNKCSYMVVQEEDLIQQQELTIKKRDDLLHKLREQVTKVFEEIDNLNTEIEENGKRMATTEGESDDVESDVGTVIWTPYYDSASDCIADYEEPFDDEDNCEELYNGRLFNAEGDQEELFDEEARYD
ncbi:hypothetical protein QBC35DRAFT_447092 [Podospora australis]|uniref:Uncharacterized protein n=1 Tax=Podospora australis TaxID=1536484 RepID=A0AAN6X2J1_9PEZI|nr:hypothetical protein QBC35DRAFT_447092 [Podospora australis]